MAYYTLKVRARRLVAEAIAQDEARVRKGRLKKADLEKVASTGLAAEQADGQQRQDLAVGSIAVSERAQTSVVLVDAEQELRDVLPAVVEGLEEAGHASLALFFKRVSYARYRVRELAPDDTDATPPTAGEAETLKKLQWLEREDQPARFAALSGFVTALLATGREPIVTELEERGFTRAGLEALAAHAKAASEAGPNRQLRTDASKVESDNVLAQQKKWKAIRRLVRRAVAGDPALERMFAAC